METVYCSIFRPSPTLGHACVKCCYGSCQSQQQLTLFVILVSCYMSARPCCTAFMSSMHQVVCFSLLCIALMLLGEQQIGPAGRACTAAVHAVKQRRCYVCVVVAGVPALVYCCQRLQVMHLHDAIGLWSCPCVILALGPALGFRFSDHVRSTCKLVHLG